MNNADRARFGRIAINRGTPDALNNDFRTNAIDTLANIAHALDARGIGFVEAVVSAERHFAAELADES